MHQVLYQEVVSDHHNHQNDSFIYFLMIFIIIDFKFYKYWLRRKKKKDLVSLYLYSFSREFSRKKCWNGERGETYIAAQCCPIGMYRVCSRDLYQAWARSKEEREIWLVSKISFRPARTNVVSVAFIRDRDTERFGRCLLTVVASLNSNFVYELVTKKIFFNKCNTKAYEILYHDWQRVVTGKNTFNINISSTK